MTTPETKTTNVTVPVEYADQVQRLLEQLRIEEAAAEQQHAEAGASGANQEGGDVMQVEAEDYINADVQAIVGHRLDDTGEFEFKVKWAGRGNGESWLTEEECDNCELAISRYLLSKGIKTCYCFCRVSSKAQTGPTHVSLDAQESELRAKAATMQGIQRIKVIKISASAYKGIPRRLKRIGEACTAGDSVLIYRVDRLSRNIVKYLAWMEELNDRGVLIYALAEDQAYHRVKLDFIQGVLDANKEAQLIGSRVKMALKLCKERGDEAVGGLPYGKMYQRIYHETEVDEEGRPKVVRKIVVDDTNALALTRRVRASRESDANLAARLNREGIRKRGRRWTAAMVSNMRGPKPRKTIKKKTKSGLTRAAVAAHTQRHAM